MKQEIILTNETINILKNSYHSNKEDLRHIELSIIKNGMTDEGLQDATESFEQGWNNAMEYMFNLLGIKY